MGQRRVDRAFHVRREPRQRYAVDLPLIGTRGDLVIADTAGMRRLAARMNVLREPGSPSIQAGEIGALGLLHEIGHLLIARYEAERRPGAIRAALADLEDRLGPDAVRLLDRFGEEFPGQGAEPETPAQRLEEMLLTRVANENPAVGPIRELIDDTALEENSRYRDAIARLEATFSVGPSIDGDGTSLLELIRMPARRAPTSLAGQLRFVRATWGDMLGSTLDEVVDRLDVAVGILAEEERALHLRFGGGAGGPGGAGGGPGRAGDQVPVETPSFATAPDEPEAFSSDSAWMPRVVLIAKSTYVWLDQLSRTYGREIQTLDGIPDEELDTLAGWGVTGLWLIGLWERSKASETIKRLRGQLDAVASAYSLDDYTIALDLGGDEAYANLRDRAWARGIRLSSDMVPNHMGIDSRWVIEHPERFLSLPEPPYPVYSFTGPDLSDDPSVGIVLEDHYWDDTDAAVVFKRVDRETGDERYIYHGNDGTSFAWNDTAQLDFLDAAVREQVIQTILTVARQFPIIRFDAAMVLAKKHIQRLWWPEPGSAGAIPSRAEHAMPKAEFERRMPNEFWREVVDRVAEEVPGTLLLAEAFWLLEGYFVRTLGMHRVYNSAFMHMLRDEDGAGYRKVIKETIEFDPEILKRYVNFMSNPDEKPALQQFGKGDKYFGVATVLATLPGLPMLGHGQVQGFGEQYGMEFRRAMLDEKPDPWLAERHERDVFPLLHRRAWFAEADDFLLYDLVTPSGVVDEAVLAYSNGSGRERSLVIYHTRFGSTSGTIRISAKYAVKAADGSKRKVRRSLAEGLGLPDEHGAFVAFRDARTGLEYLRSAKDLWEHGLAVSLDSYGTNVFWEFRDLTDGVAGQWSRLAGRLAGSGVPSLDDALRELQLEPLHGPLRAIFADGLTVAVLDGVATPVQLDELERRVTVFLVAVSEATGVGGDPAPIAASIRVRAERAFVGMAVSGEDAGFATEAIPQAEVATLGRDADDAERRHGSGRRDRATLLAWLTLSPIGALAPDADVPARSLAWYDELRVPAALVAGLHDTGFGEGDAWGITDHVRLLLALPRPSAMRGSARVVAGRLLDAWLARESTRVAIGLNTWQGVEYLDRDRLAELLTWAVRLDTIDARDTKASAASVRAATRLAEAARAAGYRVDGIREALGSASRTSLAATAGGQKAPKVTTSTAMKKRGRPSSTTRPAGKPTPRKDPKPRLPEDDPPQE
jgi:glycosidase